MSQINPRNNVGSIWLAQHVHLDSRIILVSSLVIALKAIHSKVPPVIGASFGPGNYVIVRFRVWRHTFVLTSVHASTWRYSLNATFFTQYFTTILFCILSIDPRFSRRGYWLSRSIARIKIVIS